MNQRSIPPIEWRTLLLLTANYVAFGLLCAYYHLLPWWLILVSGSVLVCLHGSIQHEVIHGHPTRNRLLNEWLVFPAVGMWLPYGIYRDTHLKHHVDEYITDPFEDPESYYVGDKLWKKSGAIRRRCLLFRNTIVGRLVLGPAWACFSLLRSEIAMIRARNYAHLHYWPWHFLSVSLMVIWLWYWTIPLNEYLLLFAYPGLSLTMLRSFLEHQADPEPSKRTAVVKSGKVMGLLFLNNNLHALHHEQPSLPWYLLPAEYDRQSSEILARNGGYFYSSYLEIICRYLVSPKTHPRHPYS